IAEPFVVKAPYHESEQEQPIHLSTHEGQEMDLILSGQLKIVVGDQTEVLSPGDVAYYNSSRPHGMIAVGGEDCEFLAVVMKQKEAEVPGK
ncbi:MAG: cupin domain-containing protein, partial [Clostridiales bacterium]|nr:cupin domain-containing protein [Clostridiales bacterium]